MKKIALGILLSTAMLFGADVSNKDCIEHLEDEIIQIVSSGVEGEQKQKAIEDLKLKMNNDFQYSCEKEFENEIKRLVHGKEKTKAKVYADTVPDKKESIQTADMNSQDCIDNFSAEVMNMIYSNPNNPNKHETKQIMHEVLHEKVQESCEEGFEQETKDIVHSKE